MNELAGGCALLLGAASFWIYRNQYQKDAQNSPPYIPGLPVVGVVGEYSADPQKYIMDCREKYGDIFTVYLGGSKLTYVCDPALHSIIYKEDNLTFEYGDIIGQKVFDCSVHQYHEIGEVLDKQYGRYLSGESLHDLTSVFSTLLENKLTKLFGEISGDWRADNDLFEFTTRLLFHTGTDTLWGDEFATDELLTQFRAFDSVFALLAGLPKNITNYICSNALKMRSKAWSWIDSHKNMSGQSRLIDERTKWFDQISPNSRAVYDFVFMWASQGNAVPAAFWALYYILRDKEAYSNVKEEIMKVLGDKSPAEYPNYLKELSKLDSAIAESLRLTSSSYSVRHATNPLTLTTSDGKCYTFKKGDQLIVPSFIVHYDPDIYEDPETYKYDRFLGKKKFHKNGKLVTRPELAFGGGISYCPGRYFAKNEIKLYIIYMLKHFDVELTDSSVPSFTKDRCGLGIYQPIGKVAFRIRKNQ